MYRSGREVWAFTDTTWMIGNSPKSDINPALAAGVERGVRSARRNLDPGARRSCGPDTPSRLADCREIRRVREHF